MENPVPKAGGSRAHGDLALRVASAAVMAPAAIGFAYLGGGWFLLFWLVAACAVFWEWTHLAAPPAEPVRPAVAGAAGLVLAGLAFALGYPAAAGAALLAGYAVAAGAVAKDRRLWIAGGVVYAAALLFAPVLLRADPHYGLAAILLLFAVVWATDIAAYFGGRLIGGPKLWTAVSPNKTWSGAASGAVAGILAGVAVGWVVEANQIVWLAAVSLLLSVASQGGDLFESALKRHFGAKDASRLIPGHGGVMDRLDGFVAAALVGALIGLARGGIESPSAGLMIW